MEIALAIGSTLAAGAASAGSMAAGAAASLGSALGLGSTAAAAGSAAGAGAGAGAATAAGSGGLFASIGTATAAAGSATTAAGTSASTLAALSGTANALSAFSMLAGGLSAKRQADQAAYDAGLAASQEQVIGLQEGNDILDNAVNTLARQRIAFGASGVNAFTGTAGNVIGQGAERTAQGVRISGDNAALRRLRQRRNQRELIRQGRGALLGSVLGAGAQGFEAAADFARIG